MIGMLRGTVWTTEGDKLVLDINGVGYLLNVPTRCLAQLKQGDEIVFFTHLVVREDDLILYGFQSREEKDLFIQLLGVSGVGPKAALAILSAFSVNQIKTAIVKEDYPYLTEVPGIGAKTAKRVILELKDKIKDTVVSSEAGEPAVLSGLADEALETLLTLGFSRNEIRLVLSRVDEKGALGTEERIKEALRLLAAPSDRR